MRKQDSRVVVTKKFLKEALVNIMSSKRLPEITIKEVCEQAEINRATFYSHYSSVSDLFDEIVDEYMAEICRLILIADELPLGSNKIDAVINIIKFIDNESDFFTLLFKNSKNLDTHSELYRSMQKGIFNRIGETKSDFAYSQYIPQYFIFGGGSIINTWIENGKKEDYRTLAIILLGLLMNGALAFNKKNKNQNSK